MQWRDVVSPAESTAPTTESRATAKMSRQVRLHRAIKSSLDAVVALAGWP
jgi:hypothetical protein